MECEKQLLQLLASSFQLQLQAEALAVERKRLSELACRAHRRSKMFRRRALILLLKKRRARRVWTRVESSTFWEESVPRFSEKQFKNAFRVNRETFGFIAGKLGHLVREDTNFRAPIPVAKRLAVTLYALGSSAEYRTIASLFGIGRTTVGHIVLEVCRTLYDVLAKDFLQIYPLSERKIAELISGFENLGFPQCLGAIDGCHIEVNVPKAEATDYYNFKGWHSVILFAAVDYRYRFTYINCGSPGRCSDSAIFEASQLKRLHETDQNISKFSKNIEGVSIRPFLIGDSAFRLSHYLMKPFPFNVYRNEEEKLFNYRLSKCRRVVENTFGHLKARFRKLGRGLELHIDNAPTIVKACCVLHNLCNESNDSIKKSWLKELQKKSTREQPRRSNNHACATGAVVRDAIVKYLGRDLESDEVDVDITDGPANPSSENESGDAVSVDSEHSFNGWPDAEDGISMNMHNVH